MLPGLGGEAVLEAIRELGDIPVLIASAKRCDAERIAGLRMGADDYLAKPFNPHELTARVAAILRRTNRGERAAAVTPGSVSLSVEADDSSTRSAAASRSSAGDGATGHRAADPGRARPAVRARPRPGAVLTREQLLDAVTRRPDDVYDRVVDVHVANLRRKLGDDAAHPWLVETIPQVGLPARRRAGCA